MLTEPSSLVLRMLGAAQLYRADAASGQHTPIQLVGKQFALLAYLSCAPGRAESRALLIDLFAPAASSRSPDGQGGNDKKAGDAFRDLTRQLRSKLGRDVLDELRYDPVRLAIPITSDRDDLLDAWQRHDFARVVDVYGGEFLPRCETVAASGFALWLETERADLARRFAQAAHRVLSEGLASSSNPAQLKRAVGVARRLRDHNSLSQDAWRFLLRYLVLSGEHDEAALEAERLRGFFDARQIELEPSTRSLIALARSEAASAQTHPAAGATAFRNAGNALVGRDNELATLLAAWDRARSGQLVHVHISAAAGLGKSRLLLELRQRLRARPNTAGGVRAMEARAALSSRDAHRSFLSEVARRLAERSGALGVSESAARTLVGLNPSLIDVYKGASPRHMPAPQPQTGTVAGAVQELVGAVTLDGPIALLLDDLHWADRESLAILADVFVDCADLPVLVVSTSRDSCDALCTATRARHIELSALDVTGVRLVLTRIAPLPGDDWGSRLPDALWRATLGNPLVVNETLQLLRESSLLIAGPDGWTTTDPVALFGQLHTGNATRRRIDQLTSSERALLLLLAVAGSSLATSRLRTAAGQETAEFNSALTSLERRGLVTRRGDDWSAAHDEHAVAMREAASPADAVAAAVRLGRVIAEGGRDDMRELSRAGPLLARGADSIEMRAAFVQFVRLARAHHDARSLRALAAEFLGERAEDRALLVACVSAVPLSVRMTATWRTRLALGGAIAGLLLIGAFVAAPMLRPAAPPPDAVLAVRRFLPDGSALEEFAIPFDASHWAGVSVKDVRLSGRRWLKANVTGNGGMVLRPDRRGWTGGASVPDSGVIDIFDLDLNGQKQRITFEKLDDLQPSWAPDNRRFVFVTSRWSQRGHYDLAIYDTITRATRHLTQGDDTDEEPRWSPDGARIVFVRRVAGSWLPRLCVVDADGAGSQCLDVGASELHIAGWSDERHVWLRRTATGDSASL
ncbi:MAG TPA: AAA family ATPase, partial [Gemmatimonadaceae bacterium]|nr:AAA family ATPase [Gemmatimonadaceae bacterium]